MKIQKGSNPGKIKQDIATYENVRYHRPIWYNKVSRDHIPFTREHPMGDVAGYMDEIGTLHIFDVEEPQGIVTTYAFVPKESKFIEKSPCPDTLYDEGFLGFYLRKYGL